jgi:hypothetical protein
MQSVVRRPIRRSVELTRTDWWMLGFWFVNLLAFLHVVLFETPLWVTYAYNGLLYCIGAAVSYYSKMVRTAFVLGTVAGFVELGADSFLVQMTGTLVYPESLPMLLDSPLYMPLAWAIVIAQLGYLGVRLDEAYGRRAAMAGPSVVSMLLVGFYEYGAYYAGIWEYVGGPLFVLGTVPLYVVVAEGITFATLYEFVRLDRPIWAGVGFGLVIGASYAFTYVLFSIIGGSF